MDRMNLDNLGAGSAAEKFDIELGRVLENIQDINTEPSAIRMITLQVRIKPDQQRKVGNVSISCVSKLAPEMAYETQVYFSPNGKEAFQADPRQIELFDEVAKKAANVSELPKQEKAK